MSSQDKSIADRIRDFAEGHRGRKTFGPNHPAVKAAKRYCERTGRSWEIGIGGRCELGKRAIKQWLYEVIAPIRRVWQYAAAKWTISLALVVAAITAGIIFEPMLTAALGVGVAVIIGGVLGAAAGYMSGDGFEFRSAERWGKTVFVIGWVLGSPVAMIVFLCTLMVNQSWWWKVKRVIIKVLKVAFFVAVGGSVIAMIVWAILAGHGIDLLILVGILAAIAGVVGAAMFGVGKAIQVHERRVKIRAQELRKDATAQAAAREKLLPALQQAYDYEKAWRQDHPTSKELLPFDQWVEQIGEMLVERGYAWTDMANPRLTWIERYNALGFFGYEVNDLFTGPVTALIDAIDGLLTASMKPSKRRRRRFKEIAAFVTATLFMLKSEVCPNVDLPDWDSVNAEPEPELR